MNSEKHNEIQKKIKEKNYEACRCDLCRRERVCLCVSTYLEGAMMPYLGEGTGFDTGMVGKLRLGGGLTL